MKEEKYFYTNLKYLRQLHGLTQGELGNKIRVDQTTIGRWEDGNREPTIGNVINIAKFFGVDLNSLLCRDLRNPNYYIGVCIDNDARLSDAIRSFADDKEYETLLIRCTKLTRPNRDKILELVNMYLLEQEDAYRDNMGNIRLIDEYNEMMEEIRDNMAKERDDN